MRKKRIKGRSGGPTLYHTERETENYSGILEPSVAQPPLPLQEFLPLQPLSLALQPPLPLQELRPLQACFSTLSSAAWPAMGLMAGLPEDANVAARATVPPRRPVKAAVSTRELLEIFMTLPVLIFYA